MAAYCVALPQFLYFLLWDVSLLFSVLGSTEIARGL